MTAAFTVSENDKAQSFDLGLDVSEGMDYFEDACNLGAYSTHILCRVNTPRTEPSRRTLLMGSKGARTSGKSYSGLWCPNYIPVVLGTPLTGSPEQGRGPEYLLGDTKRERG